MAKSTLINQIDNNITNHADEWSFSSNIDGTWTDFTWKYFGNEMQKVSTALLNHNVKEGERVGIFSQNMAEWTIIDIATIRLRAVIVPVYSTNSKSELAYVINDASIKILFVGNQEQYDKASDLLDKDNTLKKIIALKKDIKLKESDNAEYYETFKNATFTNQDVLTATINERQKSIKGSDLATIIYTSGTTGEPKGVMLDHKNFTDSIHAHLLEESIPLREQETSLNFLPLSHIFERAWVFFCLYKRIPIFFNEDPKRIAEVLKEVKPTLMCSVPRLYEKIYSTIQEKKAEASIVKQKLMDWAIAVGRDYYINHVRSEKDVPAFLRFKFNIANKLVLSKIRESLGGNIHIMPCGGAPLSAEIFRFFHAIGINVKLGYGLTETSATATLTGETHLNFESSGKALYGTEVKIGQNSEIYVKGAGVMRGYFNKPKETEKVFEDGWFKTGDAGKFDENNNLIITDRIKDLIKTSGGKYVAPQKLESNLINDPFIEQIAIIGEERKFISALIVPSVEMVKLYAEKHDIPFVSIEVSIKTPEIINKIERNIKRKLHDFSPHEQIKKFTLLSKEFTMEAGELTPTLKIKRKVIAKKYKNIIDQMYK